MKYRIKELHYKIKWFYWWFQRAKRGYADCDVWSLEHYLNSWLPKALRQLKENVHGHPCNVQGLKTWQNILENMALGFEAGERASSDANWVMNPDSEMVLKDGKVEFTNNWTPEQIKHFRELDKRDMRKFKQGIALFTKYYPSLWD